MFLHIGENKNIRRADIVGIFDSDTCTVSKITREYLKTAEKNGVLEPSGDLPKSFIVTKNKTNEKIYFSKLSSGALVGRAEYDEISERKNKND